MKRILLLGCLAYTTSVMAAASSKQIVVEPEDTVYGIAYNQGILTRALISANNLQPPYVLTPGQVLIIPAPNEHIAGGGETLQTIADTYAVNVDVLAHENNLHPAYAVKQGDTLIIPARDTESITETLMAAPPEIATMELAPLPSVKVASPQEHRPEHPAELPSDIAKELASEQFDKKPPKDLPFGTKVGPAKEKEEKEKKEGRGEKKEKEKDKDIKEENKKEAPPPKEEALEKKTKKEDKEEEKPQAPKELTFIWPVQGQILKEFKAGSQDGLLIQVEEDTPVKAAAAGEIIYVGSEIKHLGKLILIKHSQGYVTAYAYLSETLVKKGAKVKQGDVIANSGTAKETNTGQLHFEIREGKKPVNPLEKLKNTAE